MRRFSGAFFARGIPILKIGKKKAFPRIRRKAQVFEVEGMKKSP